MRKIIALFLFCSFPLMANAQMAGNQLVNSLCAIGTDSNGNVLEWGCSPNKVNGVAAPQMEFKAGETIITFSDTTSYLNALQKITAVQTVTPIYQLSASGQVAYTVKTGKVVSTSPSVSVAE